ncbi:MAG: M1 family metallopeptidase [Patescibacteria group bacterium]
MQKKSVRLPSHISPIKYNLTIKPDLEAFTFSGHETIEVLIGKSTKEVTLHSIDIDIMTVEIYSGKIKQFATRIKYDTKSETATFIFKKSVPKGKAKLSLVFNGIINESLRGFYRSRYVIDGITKHIATTQFEATDARRAFPCFDEPAHKAIFDVSLIIPGNHTAISNTLPQTIKEHEAGYKVVEFASTPRMSTYLLAFIIGEFEFVEGYTKDKVQVRVFTTKGKKHQAKFALQVAIKSLEFYNKYFDIPYPLPVLDLIAIPDFESAAMENWGAITFRESTLLVDEDHTSLSNKQWIAIVIAHEIAHQWFGNLVTMRWWTDLWLNEGFASYMENLCIDYMFPKWHVWDLYLADRYQVALRLDSLANSHPIEVIVHHPKEIGEIFDMVSYAKGSAVIRQLAEYMGHDKFRSGLIHYLKKHSYKNTDTVDLWNSFEKESNQPIKKLMESWTKKTGYPVITISKSRKGYIGHQERFFSSRISVRVNKEKTLWQIPLEYKANNKSIKMLATKKSFPILGKSVGKVNAGEGSFLRVRYDKDTLLKLRGDIETGKLSVRDRLGVIRDLFALAEGGYISVVEALEFSLSYKHETEFIVWSEIAGGIGRVNNIFIDNELKDYYRKYARSLFSPLANRLGWGKKKGEDHSQIFLRSLALGQAGYYGDVNVIKKSKVLFTNRKKGKIEADIRGVVYSVVARSGSKKEWDIFKKLHKKEDLHEEKDRLSRAMTQFENKALLGKTLELALSKDIRDQDAPFVIGSVWQNKVGRDLAWQFIKNNWKVLLEKYGEGGHFLGRLVSPLGSHIKISDAKNARKFFSKNNAPGAERTLEQSYERIYSNSAWRKDDYKALKNWLKKYS